MGLQRVRQWLSKWTTFFRLWQVFIATRSSSLTRIWFPDQGSNPGPLDGEHWILATVPPGNSLFPHFFRGLSFLAKQISKTCDILLLCAVPLSATPTLLLQRLYVLEDPVLLSQAFSQAEGLLQSSGLGWSFVCHTVAGKCTAPWKATPLTPTLCPGRWSFVTRSRTWTDM